MTIKMIQYPKCTTCKKAQAWLKENNIEFSAHNILRETPTQDELRKYWGTKWTTTKKIL